MRRAREVLRVVEGLEARRPARRRRIAGELLEHVALRVEIDRGAERVRAEAELAVVAELVLGLDHGTGLRGLREALRHRGLACRTIVGSSPSSGRRPSSGPSSRTPGPSSSLSSRHPSRDVEANTIASSCGLVMDGWLL